jgi:RNA polymerase sigma-70 factor (ECF subfamily)
VALDTLSTGSDIVTMRTDGAPVDAMEFIRSIQPYHRELLAHCQRMLGSSHDAEDQVQETYLRAWRSFHEFEGRSSLRTWLYRIATNVCNTALDRRRRLPVPSGLAEDERDDGEPATWPARTVIVDPAATMVRDPAEIVSDRDHRREALSHAWQQLSPRQRRALLLRDVLDVPATEVADLIGTSGNAVHTMMHRSRARLERTRPTEFGRVSGDPALDEYAAAFETGDVAGLTYALTDDATFAKASTEISGRDAVRELLARCPLFSACHKIPVRVRGNHGFGVYRPDGERTYRAYAVEVLTTTTAGVRRIEVIEDRALFATFGLPLVVNRAEPARVR